MFIARAPIGCTRGGPVARVERELLNCVDSIAKLGGSPALLSKVRELQTTKARVLKAMGVEATPPAIVPNVEALIRKERVFGVQAKGDRFDYALLESAQDLRLDYDVTLQPPKKFFQPPAEVLGSLGLRVRRRGSVTVLTSPSLSFDVSTMLTGWLFETGGYLAFVISDMPAEKNLEWARNLQGPLRSFLG